MEWNGHSAKRKERESESVIGERRRSTHWNRSRESMAYEKLKKFKWRLTERSEHTHTTSKCTREKEGKSNQKIFFSNLFF